MAEQRFVLIENDEYFPQTERTRWYYDTERSLMWSSVGQPFVAVQCDVDRDPNDYVRHDDLTLVFTDQAEYYCVCPSCRDVYGHLQWSGSTRIPDWEVASAHALRCHQERKGWCEFCDPVFGNGGWRLD